MSKYLKSIMLSLPIIKSKPDHSPLPDSDPLLHDDELEKSSLTPRRLKINGRHIWVTVLQVALVVFVVATCVATTAYFTKLPTDRQCARKLSTYSPLLDVVEYEEVDFVNPFAHKTIYRGPPTDELEEAWKDLWYFGSVSIPEDKMPLLNRSTQTQAFKPDASGSGYHALIEMFHQLHCLNLIRQYTWRDYYVAHPDRVTKPSSQYDSDIGSRMHVDHCIEALRISLMCHGDTTPYLVKMDPDAPLGTEADFSPHHKCVKFDPLVQYMRENVIG